MAPKRLAIGLLLSALAFAGCSTPPPPPDFPQLSYSFLRPLRLNVGAIDVDDSWAPAPGSSDVSAQSPAPPVATLARMARDRLVPSGASGRAVFTIEQASITNIAGQLNGLFRIRLDIYTSDGKRAAYAEAAVARTAPAPDDDDAMPSALYDLTKHMMSDMNVELEYQLRRSLGDWLELGPATAPPPPAVQQQNLPPPPGTGGYKLVPSPPPGSPE
jgi:hypothetical protein